MIHKRLGLAGWLIAIGSLGAIGIYFASAKDATHQRDRVYRIGWEEVPPFQTKGANGAPTGFGVELLGAAARRRGIRLEWVWSPKSSESSLREGLVDLWPLMTITPERKQYLHISDPYLQHDHYLMIRADSPYSQLQDFSMATVAHLDLAIAPRILRGILPNAHLLARPSTKDAIEDVCAGRADAAFTDEFTGVSTLFNGLACVNQPLRTVWIPSLQTQLGVGATFAAQSAADEIREEIGAMGDDGELRRIMTRWGSYLPRNLETTNALLNAKRAQRNLSYTIAFFVGLLLLAVVAAGHIRRQQKRIQQEVEERERAERTLREWERRFRDLLENAQLIAIIIDLNKGISFCNSYALSITGWTREEVIGHPAEGFVDAEYLRQLEEAIEVSPAAGGPLPLSESAMLTKDGQRRWIQWASTVLRDCAGRASGFASLGEDVTELKRLRAEAAIRESEERFRTIFQEAAVGVAQVDLEGHVTLANERYCAILGATREELVGRTSRTHPDDIEPQAAQRGRLLAGEIASFSTEKRYIHKDGTVLWVRVHESLIRDHENRPSHFIAVLEDVTERKKAEAALRESEERFRNMADTAPVIIWVSGVDKQCTFVNKGWLAFTGRTLEQELGEGWAGGVHPDDLDRCVASYYSAFDERRAFQMEYRMRSADGTYRWVRDEGVPRFASDGVFAGYIGSCVDVTDIRRSHEEAMARQKLESVGVLAGGIAHDFNNLLGSIMADAELALADLPPGSPAGEGIARINAVALRAAEIVRELMVYAGNESAVFEPVDVSALVGEMIQLLKVSIAKGATLKVNLPTNLPAVRANAAQIRQVVLNLVTNATESLGGADGTITIAARRTRVSRESPTEFGQRLPEADYLRLEVTDTGCGMTEEVQARIFDPFFTTKFAGRGLGLAAVQGIVRGHGGAINVKSAPGRGTRFEILLPFLNEMAPKEPHPSSPQADREAGSTVVTVLLVEDEESLRAPVSKMLRKKGYSIIEAGNGDAALDLFRAHKKDIDMVVLDMTLPGRSGPEIFSQLQIIRPDVKVVFTTAYSQETLQAALAGRGSFGFLRKPYDLADLLNLLREAGVPR